MFTDTLDKIVSHQLQELLDDIKTNITKIVLYCVIYQISSSFEEFENIVDIIKLTTNIPRS